MTLNLTQGKWVTIPDTGSKAPGHNCGRVRMSIQIFWFCNSRLLPTSRGLSLRLNIVPLAGVSLPSHTLRRASSKENFTRATTWIRSFEHPLLDVWKTHRGFSAYLRHVWICTYDFHNTSQPHSIYRCQLVKPQSSVVRLAILISILWKGQLRNDGTSSKLLLKGRPNSGIMIMLAQTTPTRHSLAYHLIPSSPLRCLWIGQRDQSK